MDNNTEFTRAKTVQNSLWMGLRVYGQHLKLKTCCTTRNK